MRDTVVINTCAVTAEAVRQARQTIRALRRERPQAKIVVTGCAAQTEPQTFAAMAEADRVLGNTEKLSAVGVGANARRFRCRRRAESDRQRHHGGAGNRAASDRRLFRAHARLRPGAERLRSPLHLLHHSLRPRQFALGADGRGGRGCRSASSPTAIARSCSPASTSRATARDLPGAPKLGALVKQILKHVPELKRLRLSSIDSVEADRDLIDAFAQRRAADAASASVAAGRRRSHPQAHEAPAFARRRRSRSVPALRRLRPGHGVRRRYHRRLPDRDGGYVRTLARRWSRNAD